MNRTEFIILDVVGRNLGRHISILELTREASKIYGSAYYKNIYQKVQEMKGKGLLRIAAAGNTSFLSLNFDNYMLSSLMAEAENEKKAILLRDNRQILPLMQDMERCFRAGLLISSVSIARPEKLLSRRRAELLFILPELPPLEIEGIQEPKEKAEADILKTKLSICSIIKMLENHYNIKIDSLALKRSEFFSLLESGNPEIGDILSDQLAFFRPEDFWITIGEAAWKGAINWKDKTDPSKISESDIAYNAIRFGYSEFGEKAKGKETGMEYIIVSMLLSGKERWKEAVPVILAKNKANYPLLIFLSNKYNVPGKLLGLLNILAKTKKDRKASEAAKLLEAMEIKEEKADEKSIRKKMAVYNAA